MSDIPFSSFYFRLSFLGAASKLDVAFQEVSGLSVQIDTEEVTCGGENRFKYRLPKLPKFGAKAWCHLYGFSTSYLVQ